MIRVLAAAFALLAASAAASAGGVGVAVDHTRTVRLAEPAATVVVGNPAIADAIVHDGRTIFVLGRSTGVTNMIALGPDGTEIANMQITVGGMGGAAVTVYRRTAAQTYVCGSRCERALNPSDDGFGELSSAVSSKMGMAKDAAQSAGN